MGDPAGADVHDRAVGLSADLQEAGVGCPGSAFYVDGLRQIRRLVRGPLTATISPTFTSKKSGRITEPQGLSSCYMCAAAQGADG